MPTVGSRVERGAQIGGKGLIAFRGRVRTITTEVSTGWESLTISQFESEEGVDDPIVLFTAKLNKIAEKNILKTSTVPRKMINPGLMIIIVKTNRKKEKKLAKI